MRMALVSTWQEKCGIAHYAAFLKSALDPHLDVSVIPIPRETMRDEDDPRKADDHVREIAPRLGAFDTVCVQFEPGLFGHSMVQITRRFGTVVDHSGDMIVTFHALRSHKAPPLRSLLGALRRRSATGIVRYGLALRDAFLWRGLLRKLDAHADKFKVTAIAHTKADARLLRKQLPRVTVRDNPLCYMSEEFKAGIPQLEAKSALCALLPKLDPRVRFLGVFGFFGPQKSFETAIQALTHLPATYHLLVCSGAHEASLRVGEGASSYLKSLLSLVEKSNLSSRVHFIGALEDDDVLVAMSLCDAAIMPYINTGQSGSGPASLAIELDRPTFLTRSLQFIELDKYLHGTFQFFDIGNHIELAQKIAVAPRGTDRMVGALRFVEFPRIQRQFTIDDTAANYLAACGIAPPRQLGRRHAA